MRRSQPPALLIITLVFFTSAGLMAQTKASSRAVRTTPAPTPASGHLLDAQIRNENAQAKYYNAQTEKLNDESVRSFWGKVHDNPASFMMAVGAVLAALIALISFLLNYLAAQWNQRNTQFYEALRRLGDSSSAIRIGAVGLLTQMSNQRKWLPTMQVKRRLHVKLSELGSYAEIGTFSKYHVYISRDRPYLRTTVEQLVVGLELEGDLASLDRIHSALVQMGALDRSMVIQALYRVNLRLQNEISCALAYFFSSRNASMHPSDDDPLWQDAATYAGYEHYVLQDLIKEIHCRADFDNTLIKANAIEKNTLPLPLETIWLGRDATADRLSNTADRLRMNAKTCAAVLQQSNNNTRIVLPPPGIFLADTQLDAVDMRNVVLIVPQLQGADLRYANLQGAYLAGARLRDAHLFGASMDENTSLAVTDWTAADYSNPTTHEIDSRLLKLLYERYGKNITKDIDLAIIHPSARSFIAEKQREEKGKAPVKMLSSD